MVTERFTHLVDRALRVRSDQQQNPRRRRVMAGIASAAFIVGGAFAARRLDLGVGDVRWGLLVVVALAGVPLTAAVNALEYAVSAFAIGHRVSPKEALRVSVVGTAANLLPLPGSSLVRIRALRDSGSGYGHATKITAAIGVEWIAVASIFGGGWLIVDGRAAGWWFLLGGFAAQGVATALVRWALPPEGVVRRTAVLVLGVEIAVVVVSAFRLWLVLLALGQPSSGAAAVALTVGAALAGAAGIFPGGLGLREVLSALLAPLAGVPAAAGFAASGLNRLIGIVVHAPIAVALAMDRGPRQEM